MNKVTLENLIDLSQKIQNESHSLETVGVKYNLLDDIVEKLHDIILTDFGIPKDTTVELGFENENTFCRDSFSDLLYDYEEGTIEVDELIYKLKNWKSE